jgi:hypothetical protein
MNILLLDEVHFSFHSQPICKRKLNKMDKYVHEERRKLTPDLSSQNALLEN